MPHRPINELRNLPRGTGGSHRRAAIEMFRRGDFAWIKDYSKRALDQPARFRAPHADSIFAMPANEQEITVALFGDWATGTNESAKIASLIEDQEEPHYTIHLGDVYYVGSREFIEENCRGIEQPNGYDPVTLPTGRLRSFAMNGNHEAYARDGAYFYWITKHLSQPSSCFCLHNDHWCILALDTGYNSEGIPWIGWIGESLGWKSLMPRCELPKSVLHWVRHDVQPYLTPARGLLLLTHHQPCSAFDNEYVNPGRTIGRYPRFCGAYTPLVLGTRAPPGRL